jgi:hypothetical protein
LTDSHSRITVHKKKKVFVVANPELNKQLRDALVDLGSATDEAGHPRVLRVLVSHPAKPNDQVMQGSPVAQVDITSMSLSNTYTGPAERHAEKTWLCCLPVVIRWPSLVAMTTSSLVSSVSIPILTMTFTLTSPSRLSGLTNSGTSVLFMSESIYLHSCWTVVTRGI